MKYVALISLLSLVTGCTGFLGLEYKTLKYGASSQHTVRGMQLAGEAQADGKYEIVIAKKGEQMQAWVERDGGIVEPMFEGRRAFPNPYWPFAKPVASRKGTPGELGLLDDKGTPCGNKWLLHIHPRHRVVSLYYAAAALYGEEAVKIGARNESYWIEITKDGKTYYDPCRGVYREHYQSYQPNSRNGEWTVQWRGDYKAYQALADKDTRTPEEIAANRAESHKDLRMLDPWYWNMPNFKRYGPVRVQK